MSLEGLEETTSSLQMQVDHIAKNMTPFEVHRASMERSKSLRKDWLIQKTLRTQGQRFHSQQRIHTASHGC